MRSSFLTGLLFIASLFASSPSAWAWGDEGHEIIATAAAALLRPEICREIQAMLAADDDPLTDHDIASEATWADHLRDANPDGARNRTRQWHFVDIELRSPSLNAACFGRPDIAQGVLASSGPARSCVVDKIDQFAAELARPGTPPDERLVALKFLLHFVGDVHQPLHAADDEDRGGNDKRVSAQGFRAGNLHHYWDTEFVQALSPSPEETVAMMLRRITPATVQRWSGGSPADWARESFDIAYRDAYGPLPPPGRHGNYRLNDAYVDVALRDVDLQLSKAAIRLAALLNRTLARSR